MNPGEFPHSEISGSMLICSSPKLIAAYHAVWVEFPIIFDRIVAGLVVGFYDDAFDAH